MNRRTLQLVMAASTIALGLVTHVVMAAEDESAAAPPPAPDLAGNWLGTLDVAVQKLRLGLVIERTSEAGWSGVLYSIDQGNAKIPIETIEIDERKVQLGVPKVAGSFAGKFDQTGEQIEGRWKQGPVDLPLTFRKVEKLPTFQPPSRPQEPKKPYPYREEEITFHNEQQDVTLSGAMTLPAGEGPFPAVVLISGSGPQNRDEELLGHRPFLVLADSLTRRGIAVLRYDDRGFGKSGGDFSRSGLPDFAEDAWAAFQYLQSRPECDKRHIGLIGHSEGGMIAPLLAGREADIAFIVMISGPGASGEQVWLKQHEQLEAQAGIPPDDIASHDQTRREIVQITRNAQDEPTMREKIISVLKDSSWLGEAGEKAFEVQAKIITAPWFRSFLAHDSGAALRRVTCPVLAIFGEKDWQVPPQQNAPAVESALREAGNQEFQVRVLPGLNHLLQPCQTGMPDEYASIEITMSDDALTLIGDWILQQSSRRVD